jgi:hypothetical protein
MLTIRYSETRHKTLEEIAADFGDELVDVREIEPAKYVTEIEDAVTGEKV